MQSRESDDPLLLQQVADNFITELSYSPILTGVRHTAKAESPILAVSVDEEKAMALGVSVSEIYDTLAALMGSTYINDFMRNGKINRVIMQADAEYRAWIRNSAGEMIPMSTMVSWERTSGAETMARMNGYMAARFMGEAASGVSSGEAINEVERIAAETLPEGYAVGWIGQAFQEKRLGASATTAFVFGIIVVFLILAAQYERWSLPIAVVLSVPFAVLGALAATYIRGLSNDIYFQIGAQKLEQGKSVFDAALEAASLRLRPILMTSFAFILGVLPLAIATGPGAAARQSMGTGVLGGMMMATFIAIIFVPVYFTWFVSKKPVRRDDDDDEEYASPFLSHKEKQRDTE